jgi:hypothetical protein
MCNRRMSSKDGRYSGDNLYSGTANSIVSHISSWANTGARCKRITAQWVGGRCNLKASSGATGVGGDEC